MEGMVKSAKDITIHNICNSWLPHCQLKLLHSNESLLKATPCHKVSDKKVQTYSKYNCTSRMHQICVFVLIE